jgi:hypothetical protein
MPNLDLAVNSKLEGNGIEYHLNGRIKLFGNAKIYSEGKTTIYCHGGFEASPDSYTQQTVVFHVYGGSYSTENLKNIQLSGFVNNLFVNDDWYIPHDLEVFTIDGIEDKELKVYDKLAITETTNNINSAFKINLYDYGSVQLNGPNIDALIFSENSSEGWDNIKSNAITNGGLYFNDNKTWTWTKNINLDTLSGKMKFNGNYFPVFANASRDAKITNNGNSYYPIPNGISLMNLEGKFDPSGGHFTNETINCELNQDMHDLSFVNCIFKPKNANDNSKVTIKNGINCSFINCVFEKNVELDSSTALNGANFNSFPTLSINNCVFKNTAIILKHNPDWYINANISGNYDPYNETEAKPLNTRFSKSYAMSYEGGYLRIKTSFIQRPEYQVDYTLVSIPYKANIISPQIPPQQEDSGSWSIIADVDSGSNIIYIPNGHNTLIP